MSSKKQLKRFQEQQKELISLLRKMEFPQFEIGISHQQNIPEATYSPWLDSPEFLEIYQTAKDNTLVDIYRMYELHRLVSDLKGIDADILEVGVWRGGTGAIMSKANESGKGRTILADTFEGVVKASEKDTVYRGGEHSDTSLEHVSSLLQSLNCQRVEILKGIFPDDFPDFKIDSIKLCHIDVDTYDSALDIFKFAWPKLIVGGVVVFDDYGFWTCEGVTKLFNELEIENGTKIHNLNGQGIIVKTK